jgi:hypothetical protein
MTGEVIIHTYISVQYDLLIIRVKNENFREVEAQNVLREYKTDTIQVDWSRKRMYTTRIQTTYK